jgi:iron(III) transport system substrate-binding protein
MRTHNWKRTVVAAAVAGVALLTVAACSSSGSSGGGGGGGSSSAPSASSGSSAPATGDPLEAAAKSEGSTLNLYDDSDYPFLNTDFASASSWVHVNTVSLSLPDVRSRWLTELAAGVHTPDVVVTNFLYLQDFEAKNALAKVQVPNDAGLPQGLVDATGYSHAVAILPIVFGYNTNLTKQAPASLWDLGQPAWKGKVAMDDPLHGSVTAWLLASVRKQWGDAKWDQWLAGLKANNILMTADSGSAYQAVLTGERSVCICTYSDILSQKAGTPVAAAFYSEGVRTVPVVAVVAAKAPHPKMAAYYLNWLLSPTGGEQSFAKSGRTPAVPVPGSNANLPPAAAQSSVSLLGLLGDYQANTQAYLTIYGKYFK